MFQQGNQAPLEKSIPHCLPHLGVMGMHCVCYALPNPCSGSILLSNSGLRNGGTGIISLPYHLPQIVPGCIWWHSHLTGIAFQSVPSDWTWSFLPVCGNGALIPSSQGYFHLSDLFHLTWVSVHYPHTFPLHPAC